MRIAVHVVMVRVPVREQPVGITYRDQLQADPTMKAETRWRATADDGNFFAICDATNEALAIAGALRVMADHYDAKSKVSA